MNKKAEKGAIFRSMVWIRCLGMAGMIILLSCPVSLADIDEFPSYSCLTPNVDFWTRIYGEFESTKGVIHDKYRLDIIYAAIDLKPSSAPGSRSTNRQRIKNAKSEYRSILRRLAQGKPARKESEKRVVRLFGQRAAPADFQAASYHLRCQIGQKDRFRAGIIRSGAYIEEIKSIFRKNGLPEKLAYLPHVESSYHPQAHSKSGAAGIWQFTRSTGKKYLKITYEIDERWDPLAATRGAAKLLQHNYHKFKSWPLAITAYNHGTAGVLAAIRRKGDYEGIFKHYRSRRFRFASRNFYSEFLAACRVAENSRTYFGELSLDKPLSYEEVKLKGYVRLPQLIKSFQLDEDAVYRLNPALSSAVRKGRRYVPKGFRLRLPVAENAAYVAKLDSLYEARPPVGQTYIVHRGDTAGEIARMHGVRLTDLILANDLDSRARIYPNQKLKIPRALKPSEPPRVLEGAVAAKRANPSAKPTTGIEKLNLQKNSGQGDWQTYGYGMSVEVACPSHRPDYFAVKRVFNHDGRPVGIVHVKAEETIGHFAEWLEMPARHIRRLNRIRYGRPLKLNQKLKVPLEQVSESEFEARRVAYHQKLARDFFSRYRVASTKTYTVKKGDNIWKLANQDFNVPVWLIKRFNSNTDFSVLVPARQLIIPVVDERQVEESA